jgi:ribose/xylose/arabinose/galactoside ABC-type transport system permease subunit
VRPETRQTITIGSILFALCVLLAMVAPAFLTRENLLNVLLQSATNCVLAVGMTFVIITAGIDLSVGSVLALSSVVLGVVVLKAEAGVPTGLLCAAAAGTVCGLLQGAVIVRWAVPPFVCTLGMMSAARGLALILTKGQTIHGLPPGAVWLGQGKLIDAVPVPAILSLAAVAVAHIVLTQTAFGRQLFAVGANEEAARLAGVRVGVVKLAAYVICGFTAGLAGIIVAGRTGSASPIVAKGDELDAIAAAVIGGNSLMGGRGTVIGTLVGALLIQVLRNGLNLRFVPDRWQLVLIGSVIVLAAVIDRMQRRREP